MSDLTAMPAPSITRRWFALYLLCLGILMMVLDTTIVNIALPSITADLSFTGASAAWVINAYIVTFGGFLLLAGRLGDLLGHRRVFLAGLALFTLASLACALSSSSTLLIASRSVQGLGSAGVSATSLTLIIQLFSNPSERPKAMAVYAFVGAAGSSIGVLLGGVLTDTLSWHWIFLINIPVGIAVFLFSLREIPEDPPRTVTSRPDVPGAITITAALLLAIYAIVTGSSWMPTLLAGAAGLLALFVFIESRTRVPLVPFSIFRLRSVTVSNLIAVIWAAAAFAWLFLSALYLQLVLGFRPMQVGLAFLPANLIMAAFALGLSARLVARFGLRLPLTTGLLLTAAGLALLGVAPLDGGFMTYVLPALILYGIGSGIASNPLFLAAMIEVDPRDSGLASGIIKTSFLFGGALGLATLANVAASYTHGATISSESTSVALSAGYQAAFLVAALLAAVSAALTQLLPRRFDEIPAADAEQSS